MLDVGQEGQVPRWWKTFAWRVDKKVWMLVLEEAGKDVVESRDLWGLKETEKFVGCKSEKECKIEQVVEWDKESAPVQLGKVNTSVEVGPHAVVV